MILKQISFLVYWCRIVDTVMGTRWYYFSCSFLKNRNILNPIPYGGGVPWRYQLPFCGGCTNQFQISWLFQSISLLSSGEVIFHFFFVISTKKLPSKFFFDLKNNNFLTKMVKIFFFSQILTFIVSKLYSVCFEKFFEVHYMSVCQKLTMLKFVPHPSHQDLDH